MAGKRWSPTKVDELIRRGVLALNDGYRVRNVELGKVGIPFVRGGDIGDGDISTSVEDHVLPEFADRVRSKLTQPYDVAFITKGTVGRVGLIRPGQPPSVFAPQVCYWRSLDREQLDPRFLFYLLMSDEFQANLDAVKTHGSMAADYVSLSDQRHFNLTIPPPNEQKAIARILGTLDDKIELNRRMNATLEAMARALFQSWFVDFDPVHTKAAGRQPSGLDAPTAALFPAGFQDSELGEIPKGWTATNLGSVLDVIETGRRPKGGVSGYATGVPSIGAESIWGIGEFDFGKTKFVPVEFFEKMNSGKVQHLDVLLYKDGGKPGEFRPRVGMFGHDFPFEEFGINEHVFRLRSSSVGQLYLYYSVADPRVLLDFANKGGKAAIPGINQADVRSTLILQPPPSVLQKFNDSVAPLIDRMLWNAKESCTLATLRDTLLPKLLSGELSSTAATSTVPSFV